MAIDPKKRVDAVLFCMIDALTTARKALEEGDRRKMENWIGGAIEMVGPLIQSLDLLEGSRVLMMKRLFDRLN